MNQPTCTTCAHNHECAAYRAATVVECENYQPRCKACRHWMQIEKTAKGECPCMLGWIGEDDFCSLGDPRDYEEQI